jgi:hypothetical protein
MKQFWQGRASTIAPWPAIPNKKSGGRTKLAFIL